MTIPKEYDGKLNFAADGLKPAFRLTHARGVIADVSRRNWPN